MWKQKTTGHAFLVLSELVVELFFVACGLERGPFHVGSLRERDLYRAIVQTTAEFKYTCHLTELRRRKLQPHESQPLWLLSSFFFTSSTN